ncbi:MAG: hypothetical protein WBO17_15480 [Sphingorhabdus sp.]
MQVITRFLLAVLPFLLGTMPASAQETVRDACMPDIRKYCSVELATFDRDKVRACLVRNIEKTSPACQSAAKARRDALQALKPSPGQR